MISYMLISKFGMWILELRKHCLLTLRLSIRGEIQGQSPEETGGVYGTYVEDFRGAITQPEGFLAWREKDYPLVEAA